MANQNYEDQSRIYSQLIGRVWADSDYAALLQDNPRAALEQMGVDIPANKNIIVKQNDERTVYFALEAQPSSQAFRLEVEEAAAMNCFGTVGSLGTAGTIGGTLGTAACFGTAGCYEL